MENKSCFVWYYLASLPDLIFDELEQTDKKP